MSCLITEWEDQIKCVDICVHIIQLSGLLLKTGNRKKTFDRDFFAADVSITLCL